MFWNKKRLYKEQYKYLNDAFSQQKEMLIENKDMIIFDVGACVGNISEQYTKLFENSQVHAFEPYTQSFLKLQEKATKNIKIKANKLALSNVKGEQILNINSFDPTNSLLDSHEKASYYWGKKLLDTVEQEKVGVETIDSYCKKENIKKIDILKLDTQGTEYKVLEGAKKMLLKNAISLIYMEIILVDTYIGQKTLPEITDFMDSFGYRLFNIYSPLISTNKELNQIDVIFILKKVYQ